MIYKKLLDFQKLNIKLSKDGENPHYHSEYVTLNEVLAKVKKPLNDMGVLIIQAPSSAGLTTTLVDTEDDTHLNCFMPYVELTNAQKLGSNNTYNRRYSLITLLGLEDVDTDGEDEKPSYIKPTGMKTVIDKNGNGSLQTNDKNNFEI